jgi:hypothetical protein
MKQQDYSHDEWMIGFHFKLWSKPFQFMFHNNHLPFEEGWRSRPEEVAPTALVGLLVDRAPRLANTWQCQ